MLKKTKRSSVAKMGKSIELERRHYYRKAVGLMTTGGKSNIRSVSAYQIGTTDREGFVFDCDFFINFSKYKIFRYLDSRFWAT